MTLVNAPQSEQLDILERLIVAPIAGTFTPCEPDIVTCEGEIVENGTPIGTLTQSGQTTTVHSSFTGFFMGLLAHPGERVRPGQPLAWVRLTS